MIKTYYKKDLNKIFGIDWQQTEKIKYSCLKNCNTINKIVKKISLNPENLNLICIKKKNSYKQSYLKIIVLRKDLKNFDLLEKTNNFVRTFYTKGDAIDEIKKANYIHVFSVEPDALNLVQPERKIDKELFYNEDLNFRVKIKSDIYIRSKKLDAGIDVMIDGKKYFLNIGYSHGYISSIPGTIINYTLSDFVDKSGYSLINHRNRLKGRLEKKQYETLIKNITNNKFQKANDNIFYLLDEIREIIASKLLENKSKHGCYKTSCYLTELLKLWQNFEEHEFTLEISLNMGISKYKKYTNTKEVLDTIQSLKKQAEKLKSKILKGE